MSLRNASIDGGEPPLWVKTRTPLRRPKVRFRQLQTERRFAYHLYTIKRCAGVKRANSHGLGALLGIAAQAFLAIGVIFYILPWIGLGLLDTARDVADFDLPGRVLALLWGGS